jgi:hypothetical protein
MQIAYSCQDLTEKDFQLLLLLLLLLHTAIEFQSMAVVVTLRQNK